MHSFSICILVVFLPEVPCCLRPIILFEPSCLTYSQSIDIICLRILIFVTVDLRRQLVKMSSTSNSSCRTRRSYTFSIGDSPRANLGIASFIDHAWGMGNTVNQSLCILELGKQNLSRKSYGHMEQENQKFADYREHHRRASSVTFPHFSIDTIENKDMISDYFDSKAPCIETARLQFHQAVPVRRLVYTSRSHATSNFSGQSVSVSQISRYLNEWTRELKSLFNFT